MRTTGTPAPSLLTGRKFLGILLASFAVVLAVNITFVVYALKTWPGLETETSYEDGLRYNQTLEEARQQKALGWRSDLTVAADGEVMAHLDDAFGQAVPDLTVMVALRRRVGDETEMQTSLVRSAEGYVGWLDTPAAGYWRATLTANDHEGHQYRMEFDLDVAR